MNKLPEFLKSDPNNVIYDLEGSSCILYKTVSQPHLNEEYYLSKHTLVFVLNGQKDIYFDRNTFRIGKGEAIFVQKGLYMLSDVQPTGSDFKSLLFFIDDTLIDEFIHTQETHIPNHKGYSPVFKLNATKEFEFFLNSMVQYITSTTVYSSQLFKLKVFELMHLCSVNVKNRDFTNFLNHLNKKPMTDITAFMENNFLKPITIEDYAYLTGRSLSTFKKEFRNIYQQTPAQWIKEKRLGKAYELLTKSKLNVSEACYHVGYENISHFIKIFKEKYGVTPKKIMG